MDHKIIHASRLTLVFIFAVILSGSVLTWFSINNISNQKELAEKKIIEEQRDLSGRVSVALQAEIDKVASGIKNGILLPGQLKDSLIQVAAGYDFIQQPFILDHNGGFYYPTFMGITETLALSVSSDRYITAFKNGEQAEFVFKETGMAKKYYLSCFDFSTSAGDSARVVNVLGRIAVKLNDFKEAVSRYNQIIADFSNEADINGVPYVYYALPQLLKMTTAENLEKIVPAVEFCCVKMKNGSVRLNFSTEELLQQLEKWLKGNTFSDREKQLHIGNLIKNLNQQIQFVNSYGNELQELVKKGNQNEYFEVANGFKIFNPISGKGQEILLVKTNPECTAGFLISRTKLFNAILKTDLQSGYEFGYTLGLPGMYTSSVNRDKLIYSSQIITWFPGQMMEVKLKDEGLIKKFVQRRSWIYGISSVLLLLAMLLGVVLILRDVAREKHLARLRSDFISNVTHELKTPLTSIRMYAESLMMGRVKSAEGQKEYLEVVVNESDRLKRMISNILEFSKMENGKPEYHFADSNLATILNAAIHDMNYWLEEKGFTVITEIDQDMCVKVNPEKIHQVFTNLLSNAIKYSGESRKICIRLYKKPGVAITEFEDEGIGIAEDQLKKIFDPFYRVDQSNSGDMTGTGLGLTVVKEIAEAHKGKILVDSKVGKGSTFTVSIPLCEI